MKPKNESNYINVPKNLIRFFYYSRDTSSPVRTTATSMSQFLQLTIALDKLADRFPTNSK